MPVLEICTLNLVERERQPRVIELALYQLAEFPGPVGFRPNPLGSYRGLRPEHQNGFGLFELSLDFIGISTVSRQFSIVPNRVAASLERTRRAGRNGCVRASIR